MTAFRSRRPEQQVAYRFRAARSDDLPMLHAWLEAPHVRQWWGDTSQQFELVSGDLANKAVQQFIVVAGDRPFAYLQCYEQGHWPDNGLGVHPDGTRGIDQFIGEADMVDRGHGSAFVRSFVDGLLAAGTPRVITDPDPVNARAVRAYEKAGFRGNRELDTPDGRALLMIRDNRDQFAQ
jgi:aminoglycoside 6'-N-acetyltransferase